MCKNKTIKSQCRQAREKHKKKKTVNSKGTHVHTHKMYERAVFCILKKRSITDASHHSIGPEQQHRDQAGVRTGRRLPVTTPTHNQAKTNQKSSDPCDHFRRVARRQSTGDNTKDNPGAPGPQNQGRAPGSSIICVNATKEAEGAAGLTAIVPPPPLPPLPPSHPCRRQTRQRRQGGQVQGRCWLHTVYAQQGGRHTKGRQRTTEATRRRRQASSSR